MRGCGANEDSCFSAVAHTGQMTVASAVDKHTIRVSIVTDIIRNKDHSLTIFKESILLNMMKNLVEN